MDPSAEKFRAFYDRGIHLIPDFFSTQIFLKESSGKRPCLVTSVAMFYDLEDPRKFAQEISNLLPEGGIWHFEQSYMPTMLRQNSYDTICHEHLEYYSLHPVLNILKAAGLTAVEVLMNATNGGSFAVTATKGKTPIPTDHRMIDWILSEEDRLGLCSPAPFRAFEDRVFKGGVELRRVHIAARSHHSQRGRFLLRCNDYLVSHFFVTQFLGYSSPSSGCRPSKALFCSGVENCSVLIVKLFPAPASFLEVPHLLAHGIAAKHVKGGEARAEGQHGD
jgi:hypothetical protein